MNIDGDPSNSKSREVSVQPCNAYNCLYPQPWYADSDMADVSTEIKKRLLGIIIIDCYKFLSRKSYTSSNAIIHIEGHL